MEENEKLGTIIIDGKVINLDTVSPDEMEKLENMLEQEIEDQRKLIENEIFSEINEDEK